jgi:uncharacterized protein YkwD
VRAATTVVVSVVLSAALTGSLVAPASAAIAPAASPAAGSVSQLTDYVYQQGNQLRFDKGLNGYARDARLDRVAMAWAKQQWLNGRMSHNPSYAQQIPPGWTRAGENVAAGYSFTQVMAAWVASPTHYANLMRDYTSIGIGYYEADGRRYWVQTFAKYPGTVVQKRPALPARTRYQHEPAAPAGAVLPLASGSFESGLRGWSASGATREGPVASARGGRYVLAVPGARTVTQTIGVRSDVGDTITATVWVSSTGAGTGSGTLRVSAVGGTQESATVMFAADGMWTRVSVPLDVRRSGHSGLRVEVVLGSGSFRLDSASLVRTGTGGPVSAPPAPPSRR